MMEIVEGGVGNEVKYVIPKIWVQFTGLPKELRDYMIIWAVGSILGITKMVDIRFIRRYDIAHLQVLVLDPSLIRDSVDVVIGDFLYELHFKMEPENGEAKPQPMEIDNDDDLRDGKEKEGGDFDGKEGKGSDLGKGKVENTQSRNGKFSESTSRTSIAPSAQMLLLPRTEGLTASDEEYDGLMEDEAYMEELVQETGKGRSVRELAAVLEASEAHTPLHQSKRRAK
ncbi:hypothetical protein E2562_031887 [Oryza meyeriana var. granulata]|uniref:DUF4283 domain-containing protein n=1 Tax=Oryza meyeriana var. granulata TaxID=110450 RepID=A0A6G1F039_9ORYZ|nr:hypothetical protein E2562_031887 [Oryza meyeriana var. granulata]